MYAGIYNYLENRRKVPDEHTTRRIIRSFSLGGFLSRSSVLGCIWTSKLEVYRQISVYIIRSKQILIAQIVYISPVLNFALSTNFNISMFFTFSFIQKSINIFKVSLRVFCLFTADQLEGVTPANTSFQLQGKVFTYDPPWLNLTFFSYTLRLAKISLISIYLCSFDLARNYLTIIRGYILRSRVCLLYLLTWIIFTWFVHHSIVSLKKNLGNFKKKYFANHNISQNVNRFQP